MNLTHLDSFYRVARSGSFTAAADELNVSRGLISRHVRNLERELDAKLLHRTTRVVTLTEAGQHLFAQASEIFALAQSAEQGVRDLTQDASGILRFTAPITLGERVLPDILQQFWAVCPQVRVETQFTAKAFRLVDGDQDIALRAFDTLPQDVVARTVGRIRNVVVASPARIAEEGMPLVPQDLQQRNCVIFSHLENGNNWRFEQGHSFERVRVSGSMAVSQYSTARRLALAGFGFANIPYYQVEVDIQAGRLVPVLEAYQTNAHDLYILHASHQHLPHKLRLFKELLFDWFQEHPHYLTGDNPSS